MSRSREEKLEQLRQAAMILFGCGMYPCDRISDEALDAMLAVMHPEVIRIAKVLEEVERSGWTT